MSGWMAGAVIGSAVIGYVASEKAGDKAEKAQKKGLAAQEAMAEKNLAFQAELEDEQREDFAPWRDVGNQALTNVWQSIQAGDFDVGAIDPTQNEGYQFRMDEGIKALDRSAAARGKLLGTAHDKAVVRYGQGFGSNEYATAYNRELAEKNRQHAMVSNLASQGLNAAGKQGAATSQLASTGGNIMANTGYQQNLAQQNIGKIQSQAEIDKANSANQALQNWVTYKQTAPKPTTNVMAGAS